MRNIKKSLFLAAAAVATLLSASVAFGADPAVSTLNGKISAGFGTSGPNDIYGGEGSIDLPLGGSWGAQGDAFLGGIHGFGVYGGAGHLFWRDPSLGLLGIYGSDQHYNVLGGIDVTKVGAEGEYYFNDAWTARTIVGWEGGDVKDRIFDRTDVVFYPSDNWSITAGHRYTLGINAGVLGTEYQFADSNVSLSLQGRLGEFHTSGVFAGITLFLGDSGKPLAQRARQDDPVDSMSDDTEASGGSGDSGCNDVGLTSGIQRVYRNPCNPT